mmetsp:Transcript_27956/g.75760  ORF Transcript_27956/g.75760 Transcript_27956/m.75760 type:complete len:204 (+) Transcript_27956:583-1194(+)
MHGWLRCDHADRWSGPSRLPGSEWHPASRLRKVAGGREHELRVLFGECRHRCAWLPAGEGRAAGGGHPHSDQRPRPHAGLPPEPEAQPVCVRVRVLREAGLGHGWGAGVREPPADGREAGAQNHARASRPRHRCGGPDPGHVARVGPPVRLHAGLPLPRGLHQKSVHRAHVYHAGSGLAPQERAVEAEHDQERVQGQERAPRR